MRSTRIADTWVPVLLVLSGGLVGFPLGGGNGAGPGLALAAPIDSKQPSHVDSSSRNSEVTTQNSGVTNATQSTIVNGNTTVTTITTVTNGNNNTIVIIQPRDCHCT